MCKPIGKNLEGCKPIGERLIEMTKPLANHQKRKKLLSNQRTAEKHGDQIMLCSAGQISAQDMRLSFLRGIGSLELEVSRYTNESEDVLTTFEPSSDTRSYQARAQPGTVRQRPCEATSVQGGRPYVFYAALLG